MEMGGREGRGRTARSAWPLRAPCRALRTGTIQNNVQETDYEKLPELL